MDPRTPRRAIPRWAAIVVAFLIVGACGPPSTAIPVPSAVPSKPAPPVVPSPIDSRTQTRIEYLAERVRADPADGDAQLELGLALLQRIRETGDPSLYGPADDALQTARRRLPGDVAPLVGLGGLQLGRHEFATALSTGRAAVELDPDSVGAGAIVVDALVELGRYEEAFDAAEALAARAPNLTSLSRLSYTRELRGDLSGALAAMELAAEAPSLAPENTAFALSIVGHLQGLSGDRPAARAAYEHALELVPSHAPSLAGLGRLAVGDGDLARAAAAFQQAAAILPLPEYVIALGEVHAAAGDLPEARREYDLASAEIALSQASGVAVDLELALFETDHGDPRRAVALARAAYDAAPTIRAADTLAWCLHNIGDEIEAKQRSAEALRLGTRDPLLLYHAGAIALALGDDATAREHLTAALALDPGFSATAARAARGLLETVGFIRTGPDRASPPR